MAHKMLTRSSSRTKTLLLITFAAGMQLGALLSFFFFPRSHLLSFTADLSTKTGDDDRPYDDHHHDDGEETVEAGWRNIAVYAGTIDAIAKTDDKWYGQFKQDIAVSSLLNNKRDGYFIDLASNHPTFLSSTYALERKFNWTGLCIEPNTMHWWGLSQQRKCQLVGAVIGQKSMDIVKFRVKNVDGVGGHGGIIQKGTMNEGAPDSESESFVTVSAIDVFRRMNVPHHIDYLSLDVEGAEEFIMRAFPMEHFHISLLSVENCAPSLGEYLVSNGFRMVARLGVDALWAHDSIKDELNSLQLTKYAATLQPNDPRLTYLESVR